MAVSKRMLRRLRTVFVLALGMALLILGSVFLTSAVLEQSVSGRNVAEALILGSLVGGLFDGYLILFF